MGPEDGFGGRAAPCPPGSPGLSPPASCSVPWTKLPKVAEALSARALPAPGALSHSPGLSPSP